MSVYIPGYRQTGPLSYASPFKNNIATHYDISDVSMIKKDEKMTQKKTFQHQRRKLSICDIFIKTKNKTLNKNCIYNKISKN